MPDTTTVLFVCAHNANRSQIAAGYLSQLAGDRVEVLSAGPEPSDQVSPAAVQAMQEDGIDIGSADPRLLTEEDLQRADVVVTLGCADACPAQPGKRYEDWTIKTTGAPGIEAARSTRDQIKVRVEELASQLLP